MSERATAERPDATQGVRRRLPDWAATVAVVVVVAAGLGALALFLSQVNVTSTTVNATRTCGSPFDVAADRSGWELWWARDLDEPDPLVRSSLLRTDMCPSAVNQRTAVSAILAGLAMVAGVVARRARVPNAPTTSSSQSDVGAQIFRLGRTTLMAGVVLSSAGVVAIVVLVADADSTLFLYTDRLVVAVVGLIVLMPTLALLVLGRALTIVGHQLDLRTQKPDDPPRSDE